MNKSKPTLMDIFMELARAQDHLEAAQDHLEAAKGPLYSGHIRYDDVQDSDEWKKLVNALYVLGQGHMEGTLEEREIVRDRIIQCAVNLVTKYAKQDDKEKS